MDSCFLCGNTADNINEYHHKDQFIVRCPCCSKYEISEELRKFGGQDFEDSKYLLSGLARELGDFSRTHPIYLLKDYREVTQRYPVPKIGDVQGRVKKLIERIRSYSSFFGEEVRLRCVTDYSIAYAKNPQEFNSFLRLLVEEKVISTVAIGDTESFVTLTAKGWDLGKNLDLGNDSEKAFIATWFDDTRNAAISSMERVIGHLGFVPICIRESKFVDAIQEKALGEIRESRFVIVDLTGRRPSVFF